jgi:hypothetical protein
MAMLKNREFFTFFVKPGKTTKESCKMLTIRSEDEILSCSKKFSNFPKIV